MNKVVCLLIQIIAASLLTSGLGINIFMIYVVYMSFCLYL